MGELSSTAAPSGAVLAARKLNIPIAEVYFDLTTSAIKLSGGSPHGTQLSRTQTRAPREHDVLLLLHTSGTTGRPKGLSWALVHPMVLNELNCSNPQDTNADALAQISNLQLCRSLTKT
jgi:acyl-CoA synthetase (AMP-forming)/AMP-acid ligase II